MGVERLTVPSPKEVGPIRCCQTLSAGAVPAQTLAPWCRLPEGTARTEETAQSHSGWCESHKLT